MPIGALRPNAVFLWSLGQIRCPEWENLQQQNALLLLHALWERASHTRAARPREGLRCWLVQL